MPPIRRRLEEDPVGFGDERVPYDRANPVEGEPAPVPQGMQPGEPEGLLAPQTGTGMLGEMGGGEPTTDQMSTDQLEQMSSGSEADEMLAALEDPNVPPEVKEQIQAEIAMAARRRFAGMGGA